MSVLTAKYAGTCTRCGQPTEVGDRVNWTRGKGVTHNTQATCDEATDLARSYSVQAAEQAFELGSNYGRVNGWHDDPNDSWVPDEDRDTNNRWW